MTYFTPMIIHLISTQKHAILLKDAIDFFRNNFEYDNDAHEFTATDYKHSKFVSSGPNDPPIRYVCRFKDWYVFKNPIRAMYHAINDYDVGV